MSARPPALILAAGRGERMRPLTDVTPKPLLRVGGKRLIEFHLEALARADCRDVVINTAHLAAQFPAALGDGTRYGLSIRYSFEGDEPLETGGGMLQAQRLLDAPWFIAINGDIHCDFHLGRFTAAPEHLATIVLVDNPQHHSQGDFWLGSEGAVVDASTPPSTDARRLTFAGIGSYRRELLDDWRDTIGDTPGAALAPPRFPLVPLLRAAMRRGRVRGIHHRGHWTDVGTPERLAALDRLPHIRA
jgi:MurNAc alpha-1-phosphate uridylyltransferase